MVIIEIESLHNGDYLIHDDIQTLRVTKSEFLDLYRQMTRMLVDEVVRDYDPDKPRRGFGGDEPHKQGGKTNITYEVRGFDPAEIVLLVKVSVFVAPMYKSHVVPPAFHLNTLPVSCSLLD